MIATMALALPQRRLLHFALKPLHHAADPDQSSCPPSSVRGFEPVIPVRMRLPLEPSRSFIPVKNRYQRICDASRPAISWKPCGAGSGGMFQVETIENATAIEKRGGLSTRTARNEAGSNFLCCGSGSGGTQACVTPTNHGQRRPGGGLLIGGGCGARSARTDGGARTSGQVMAWRCNSGGLSTHPPGPPAPRVGQIRNRAPGNPAFGNPSPPPPFYRGGPTHTPRADH